MSTVFKRILFDYDGTILIHKAGEQGASIGKSLGLNETQSTILSAQLENFFANQNRYYVKRKVTYDLYYEAIDHYVPCLSAFDLNPKILDEAICVNNMHQSVIAEGARETLEYLWDRGYELCIATNGFYKQQVENLKHNGLFDYFERIYTWDDSYAKPDPRFMSKVLGATDPAENVFVGNDLRSDIAMANAAGVFSIGYNLGHIPGYKEKPDIEISKFTTLMKIF